MSTKTDLNKNGAAQAAVLATMIGLLTLAVVNLATDTSKAVQNRVHDIGKLWMPGAAGIGPYSGKETLALVAWLLSWGILHFILRKKEWSNKVVIVIFLLGIAVATTLIWPPIFNGIAHAFNLINLESSWFNK